MRTTIHIRPQSRINNCDLPPDMLVAKSDYAANAGDRAEVEVNGGPPTLASANDGSYIWPSTERFSGVVYLRSRITVAAVRDGVSKTVLVGEKYLDQRRYLDGTDRGDNEPATAGADNDTLRAGSMAYPPKQDTTIVGDQGFRFGSAHPDVFHAVFCDGSAHAIDYEIDPKVFANLCNRRDGQSIRWDAIY